MLHTTLVMKKVYVGMSGGVDSSVTAALLVDQGYEVTGVYMKNWAQDLPGFECPWRDDLADAKRVAVQLGIPFKVYDFQQQYKDKVVSYLIDGYKQGITPNPDIMCNQDIKFRLFLDTALEDGADMIATGHYARTYEGRLLTGVDATKDQTYFLYRVTTEALQKTLFPLGEIPKQKTREIAAEKGLVTAKKKDSMGICFVGKVGIKDFLGQFVDLVPGPIINQNGQEIGQHDSAMLYTIGQRHGLGIGGGLPYYVVDKNIATNTVYVTTQLDDERLWLEQVTMTRSHWIDQVPEVGATYSLRTRHGGPLVPARIDAIENDTTTLTLQEPIKAITPGQSGVLYNDDVVLGGGVIIPTNKSNINQQG